MRLIDADALIEKLEEKMFNSQLMCPVIKITDVMSLIQEQPSAYDPEAVVAELEEQKVRYKNIRNNTHCIITETSECDSCRADHYLDARLNCVDRAIEIVRKGGVE
jgi:hypothetical protein